MRFELFVSLIFLIPLGSSITTTMLQAYQPGETMIIEIQGNILEPINPSDILFKRAQVAIAVNYDVKRIGDKYYIYAQMPTNQNNYTLFINDIATTVNGAITTVDYNQTFKVSGNISDYSISPGFIITDRNFILTLTSNLDQSITINSNFPQEQALTLQPGTNTIPFSIQSVSSGVYFAVIGKYTIPIQIIRTVISNQTQYAQITISPSIIKQTILENQQKFYNFSVTNLGSTTANNLYFSFDQNLFNITPSQISSLNSNDSQEFILYLKRTSGSPLFGDILVGSENQILANITLDISFTSNESQITNTSVNNQYYCSELQGKFCPATETCSTKVIQSLDGSCCTGVCQIEEKSSNSWIAYIAIILVLIILFFVYRSYKKSKSPKINKFSPISPPLRRPV